MTSRRSTPSPAPMTGTTSADLDDLTIRASYLFTTLRRKFTPEGVTIETGVNVHGHPWIALTLTHDQQCKITVFPGGASLDPILPGSTFALSFMHQRAQDVLDGYLAALWGNR